MGRARIVLLGLLLATVAAPAGAGPVIAEATADVWVAYRAGIEQVQGIQAFRQGNGLYALVYDRSTGSSRVDEILPDRRQVAISYELPSALFHVATGLDVDRSQNIYVALGQPYGGGRSPRAGIYRRWFNDNRDGKPYWLNVSEEVELQLPYAVAAHPNGSVYATDAALGVLVRVDNADQAGDLAKATIVSDRTDYKPRDAADPVTTALGRAPLGIAAMAVCPVGGTNLCSSAGNLLVSNRSTGRVWEVPVRADGTTGDPAFKMTLYDVSGMEFGPDRLLYVTRAEGNRVTAISQDMYSVFDRVYEGCPLAGPSDVAPTSSGLFVSSRASATEQTNSFCPVPSVARIVPGL